MEPQLKIIEPNGKTIRIIPGATEFAMNPSNDKLVYAARNGNESTAGIVEFKKKIQQTVIPTGNTPGYFHNLVWEEHGKAVAFLCKRDTVAKTENNSLLFFNISKEKVYELIPEVATDFPKEGHITYSNSYNLTISADLERIFFSIENRNIQDKASDDQLQIWNGNDKYIFPQQQYTKDSYKTKVAVWWPNNNRVQQINSDELPLVMLAGNHKYAITCDPKAYEPQFDFSGPKDFYIKDLQTNESKLLLKKQSTYMMYTLPSPGGKYITYFYQGNWWLYDILKDKHKNITAAIGVRFDDEENDMPDESNAYDLAGWTQGDKTVLIYDQFDIWEIETETGNYKRLTQGREKKIRFRIADTQKSNLKPNFDGGYGKSIELQKGLLLQAAGNNGNTGYFMWTPILGEQKITYQSSRIDQILQGDQAFIYREQRFDLSPRIMYHSAKRNEKVLVHSNSQQQEFGWGSAKPFGYLNASGKTLRGFLCYPANYESGKKYPMIVDIYERQFRDLHTYTNPEEFPTIGFNATNFTSKGYFVLYPDIQFEMGNTGHSAVECTVAAVKKVIELGVVDEKKIGLVGHSFGGYETDFIITQTNIFTAAISGSAATDLNSFYLTLNWTTGKPDMWRFEDHQWRMEKSLFEDRERYKTNSPLTYAQNIRTPLLSWTGQEDRQVDWHQSIEWYLALRRLNKKHILLLYPKEPHVLNKPENQRDLSKRMQEWFAYFLKDESPADWISKGIK
jgi:dipeptidyl aminopeptidase/acylaminoacyl peptidase